MMVSAVMPIRNNALFSILLIGFGFVRYVSGFRILLQNNKIMLRRDATIVQDHAKIVQTRLKRAFLDDFSSEFGRYFYPVYRNVAIFAPELNKRMKMNLKKLLALATLFIIYGSNLSAKDYTVSSPNGKNVATVDKSLNITVSHSGKQVMTIKADQTYCLFPHWEQNVPTLGLKRSHTGNIKGARTSRIAESIQAPFYRQRKIDIEGNQLDLKLRDGFGMQVRAYDEGVAYRFYTTNKKGTIIADETADFHFPENAKAWLAYSTNDEKPFAMAFQNYYDETHLSKAKDKYIFLPATIESGDVKVTILESDLRAYPGMFVKADGLHLRAAFAKYPKRMDYYKWRGMSYVAETEDYIAKSKGLRTYPWRVMAITEQDTEMPVNNLVYALATPNQIGSTDWIKPGKVAWDWWNDWNLKGVDFEAGINTRTYQYYIDFAAKNHIPYVVLDEGWYDSSKGDIMNPIPAIDLQGLIDYGREKGVSIALWTVFNVLDEHLTEACEKYAKMGVKGWKVDFMDRNDQTAVEMAERLAKTCAQYQLFLDYHGFYAPTGMSRTYPNILNYEGVFGMEEARWAKKETDMPRYDVTFPFIRMMAGQVDFTPGAMRNGTKENWVECYQNPVSMGTRCHQLACYIVHDSPFTMLCDTPTNYEREQPCVDIITSLPDTFDETKIIQGKLGSYIIVARRNGSDWYLGGQTNWDGRDVELSLDILPPGTYQATIVSDGINANHNAEDYRIEQKTLTTNDQLSLKMANGGGFLIKLIKQQ
jgi:alpha-glucosidase